MRSATRALPASEHDIWCWLAYVAILFLVDSALITRTPQLHLLPSLYYVLHAGVALLVLGLAASPWCSGRLGRAFLPFVIVCLSVLPLPITTLVAPFAIGPISGTRGFMFLRFAPVVLIGQVLLAWNYPWRYVLRCHLALPLLMIAPAVRDPQLALTTTVLALLQTVASLVISYCIGVLVERLRRQEAALRQANRQLQHYASTLEHLTISRERNRVARELHDTLAHTLSSLSVQLETVKAYWEIDLADGASAARERAHGHAGRPAGDQAGARRAARPTARRCRPADRACDMLEATAELAQPAARPVDARRATGARPGGRAGDPPDRPGGERRRPSRGGPAAACGDHRDEGAAGGAHLRMMGAASSGTAASERGTSA